MVQKYYGQFMNVDRSEYYNDLVTWIVIRSIDEVSAYSTFQKYVGLWDLIWGEK